MRQHPSPGNNDDALEQSQADLSHLKWTVSSSDSSHCTKSLLSPWRQQRNGRLLVSLGNSLVLGNTACACSCCARHNNMQCNLAHLLKATFTVFLLSLFLYHISKWVVLYHVTLQIHILHITTSGFIIRNLLRLCKVCNIVQFAANMLIHQKWYPNM